MERVTRAVSSAQRRIATRLKLRTPRSQQDPAVSSWFRWMPISRSRALQGRRRLGARGAHGFRLAESVEHEVADRAVITHRRDWCLRLAGREIPSAARGT